MHTKSLGGKDSLYSIVQMPPGIPVAAVAINGGKNAGLLAVRMLAVHDRELREKLRSYSLQMSRDVQKKDQKLQETGWIEYSKE